VTGFEGTGGLLRLALRRDRVVLPVWLLALSGLTYYAGHAMGIAFPTQSSIQAYAASAADSPSLIAMSGPPIALDTLPGIVLTKVWMMTLLGVCLVALFTVVRHTRSEEEEGRADLLRSAAVGRHAAGAAAILLASGASVVLGALIALALVGATLPLGSAVLYGASIAALGVVFAATGLCLAQLFTHARAADGAGLALIGVAYVVRAAGDIRENALVWVSPMGWAQAPHVLGRERWWPLLVSLVAAGLLVVLATRLSAARDVGFALVAPRDGSRAGGRLLSGPLGLAIRLERGAVTAWAAGMFVLALMMGSLSPAIEEMAGDNPALEKYMRFTGQGTFLEAFLAMMLLVMALLATGFAVASAMRLRHEETADHLEPLLATGLSRSRWLLAWSVVTVVGAVLLLLVGGFGLGLASTLTADGANPVRMAGLALLFAPAVLSLAALVVLLFGWRPGWVAVGWVALGLCFVLGWLGELLNLPDWVVNLSPFSHVPRVPIVPATWAAPTYTAVAAVLLALVGWAGFRRRDIG
jgi:ABC-2 type transport system permease protein